MNLSTAVSQDLWQAVRRSYESELWSNAILDAIQHLGDTIRSRTGLESDGVSLVGQAFGGKTPKLRVNRLETESERNIQSGVEQLLRGLYQGIRNPRSHGKHEDTAADADAVILFIDFIGRVMGHARTSFSVDDCVKRILDENFVPSERYASLLVGEIPPRQQLQVAIQVFRRKPTADVVRLRYYFSSALKAMKEEEAQEFFQIVSTDLREQTEDSGLRACLQMLSPEHWPFLDEPARLRTEHRLVRNLRDGRYTPSSRKCTGGALATWSRQFWVHFTLKTEMYQAVLELLRSSAREHQDYAFEFCVSHLHRLVDPYPAGLQRHFLEGLRAGDQRYKDAIELLTMIDDKGWSPEVLEAQASFQAAEFPSTAAAPDEDDDLPF